MSDLHLYSEETSQQIVTNNEDRREKNTEAAERRERERERTPKKERRERERRGCVRGYQE